MPHAPPEPDSQGIENRPLSVTEFTRRVKAVLEGASGPAWGRGEVSNLRVQPSGHVYFSLKDAGALIAGGSDWDVSTFDAFQAMEHAITRSEARGKPPLLPEQSLQLQDMVDAYTINAAYALKQEHTTGSLEPGKRGDFIVLDRDIFAIDPFDLHLTRVLATYLDGREVYAAKSKPR